MEGSKSSGSVGLGDDTKGSREWDVNKKEREQDKWAK
jgi:hypothetical protein